MMNRHSTLVLCALLTSINGGASFVISPHSSVARRSHQNVHEADATREGSIQITETHAAHSSTVATSALEKLLDRQKAEVLQTEKMLTEIKDRGNDPAAVKDKKPAEGLTASVLAGYDYGFVSRSEGVETGDVVVAMDIVAGEDSTKLLKYGPPSNIVKLTLQNFARNLDAILGEYNIFSHKSEEYTPEQERYHKMLGAMTLDVDKLWAKEEADGAVDAAPFLVKIPYIVLCWSLDRVFAGKSLPARFFLLETVARMPYFSYITCLHLYETLGFWRRNADLKRIHMAQEINEFHHLMIMESLGGDQKWYVRAMAQHAAIAYFVGLCSLWLISPTLNYKFSELLEGHAVNTYGQFIEENEEFLRQMPPSFAAIEYYALGASDPFLEEYQTTALAKGTPLRRPGFDMTSLYDVFAAIKADESDHVSTMIACIDPQVPVSSASLERRLLAGVALAAAVSYIVATGDDTAIPADQLAGSVLETTEGVTSGLEAIAPSIAIINGLKTAVEAFLAILF